MSYGTGLWATNQSDTPWSSDSNTPWMVADYFITTFKHQDRADVSKKVKAEGQLDVLLCSDPDCGVLVDLRNVTPQANKEGVLALCYAKARNLWASGLNTLQKPISASLHNQSAWLPREFRVTRSPSEVAPTLQAVTWLEPDASLLEKNPAPSGLAKAGALLRNDVGRVLPWTTALRLNLAHLNRTRFGLYKATLMQSSIQGDLPRGSCVVIVWPDNEWMRNHQWGLSLRDGECGYCLGPSPDEPGCPVYLFDSYLLKGADGYNGYTFDVEGPASGLPLKVYEDGCLCRNTTDMPLCANVTEAEGDPAGDQAPKCCWQRCSVLQVGNATVAAMPWLVQHRSTQGPLQQDGRAMRPPPQESSIPNAALTADALETLNKMYVMAIAYNASVMPWCGQGGLPACHSPLFGDAGDPELDVYTPANNTYTTLQEAVLTYDDVVHAPFGRQGCFMTIPGYQCAEPAAVVEGLRSIVQDATRVVDRVATAELATTDFTSNDLGAVGRISLTLAGLVAMAVGRNDMLDWSKAVLRAVIRVGMCWRHPGPTAEKCITVSSTVFTIAIVWLGSALPSVIAFVGERSARDDNPKGDTSRVSLLGSVASFVDPGLPAPPYVLVGVLSVRVTALYTPYSEGLTLLNLILGNVGAFAIIVAILWPHIAWVYNNCCGGAACGAAGGAAGAVQGGGTAPQAATPAASPSSGPSGSPPPASGATVAISPAATSAGAKPPTHSSSPSSGHVQVAVGHSAGVPQQSNPSGVSSGVPTSGTPSAPPSSAAGASTSGGHTQAAPNQPSTPLPSNNPSGRP
jgi:hypothetical protein